MLYLFGKRRLRGFRVEISGFFELMRKVAIVRSYMGLDFIMFLYFRFSLELYYK